MKNLSLITAIIFVFAFTACQQEDGGTSGDISNTETVAALDLDAEEAIESGYDDLDLMAEAGMDLLDININSNGRYGDKKQGRKRNRRDRALDCAVVDKDTVNQIVTIDFGDGCEGPNGVVRKGKIIIEYSGNRHEAGSYRMVTLEDYYADSLHIEGTRKLEVISSDSLSRVIRATMTGGKITFPDATFATRDADHTKTMVQGEDEGDDYTTITGGASGLKADGTAYTVTILEDLLIKRVCNVARVKIPVSGIKEVVNGDSTATLDYGDGTCDNEVDVTVDGVTTTITIEPKGRRFSRKG